ncbi:alpha/beta fold hydrolase [Nocardioides limicola]|uniref:alpha/beta fold hydrolase n=1 Tax=Nocardioides limicola TaxID=2803368 RepID=UPI00193C4774|nr:alpha/beta fold hydrolase [Nocardioides sp. DJM-14]
MVLEDPTRTPVPIEAVPVSTLPSRELGSLEAAAIGLDLLDEVVLGTVRDMHRAIATRVHGIVTPATGGLGRPVEVAHHGLAHGLYAGFGYGLRGGSALFRVGDRRGLGTGIESTPTGRWANAFVHGVLGDRLAEQLPDRAIRMAVRHRGADLPLQTDALRAAYPQPSADLVVFLHGLTEDESWWQHQAERHGGSYGDRLTRDLGFSALYLRANTGLAISENGVALASLLDRLVAAWPVPVRRIVLVGHSMGGLISRAACAVRLDSARPWQDLVSDLVAVATPHLGSHVAAGAHGLSRGLKLFAESAPLAGILDQRSAGIEDLQRPRPADVENLPHVRYRLVAGSLAKSERHPVSTTLGDLLVKPRSAFGRTARGQELFPGADRLFVPGADHFALLNHADVYAAMRRWLAEPVPAHTHHTSTGSSR